MSLLFFFFLNDPPTTEIYPLPLHDALPIYPPLATPDAGRPLSVRALARRGEPGEPALERADRLAPRHARRDRDGQGHAAAGLHEGGAAEHARPRQAPGPVPNCAPARLDLSGSHLGHPGDDAPKSVFAGIDGRGTTKVMKLRKILSKRIRTAGERALGVGERERGLT